MQLALCELRIETERAMITILIATCPKTGGVMYLCIEMAIELSMTECETYVDQGIARVFDCR